MHPRHRRMLPDTAAVFTIVVFYLMKHCNGHSYGYHGLTGVDPPNQPHIPAITGPFEVEAVVRLDDMVPADDRVVYQTGRLSNGLYTDIISLDITSPKTDIQLRLRPSGGVWCIVKAVNAVVQGEVATFSAGVKSNGTTWIAKNGVVLAESACLVPNNVHRTTRYIGRNYFNTTHRFYGAVLGLRIKDLNNPNIIAEQEHQSLPGQIYDQPFTVSFWARFALFTGRSGQKLFQFTTNDDLDCIAFGQHDGDNNRFEFYICRGSDCRYVDATKSGLLGLWSFWHVGITDTGTMFIQHNSVTLATNEQEPLPNNVYRPKLLLGQSAYGPDSTFWGAILGLRVDIDAAS